MPETIYADVNRSIFILLVLPSFLPTMRQWSLNPQLTGWVYLLLFALLHKLAAYVRFIFNACMYPDGLFFTISYTIFPGNILSFILICPDINKTIYMLRVACVRYVLFHLIFKYV